MTALSDVILNSTDWTFPTDCQSLHVSLPVVHIIFLLTYLQDLYLLKRLSSIHLSTPSVLTKLPTFTVRGNPIKTHKSLQLISVSNGIIHATTKTPSLFIKTSHQ